MVGLTNFSSRGKHGEELLGNTAYVCTGDMKVQIDKFVELGDVPYPLMYCNKCYL